MVDWLLVVRCCFQTFLLSLCHHHPVTRNILPSVVGVIKNSQQSNVELWKLGALITNKKPQWCNMWRGYKCQQLILHKIDWLKSALQQPVPTEKEDDWPGFMFILDSDCIAYERIFPSHWFDKLFPLKGAEGIWHHALCIVMRKNMFSVGIVLWC